MTAGHITDLPPLRDVINQYGLMARKDLGQNFLLDLNLTGRIARTAGPLNACDVIEIGPGPGGLTRSLLLAGARVVYAIERDERCVEALRSLQNIVGSRLVVIQKDALEIDISAIGTGPRRVVANLPYNIATPLLLNWLRQIRAIRSMTLMFQREVAERLTARPGSKTYGRLSVITQWLCEVSLEFNIDPKAFTPPPKVISSVVTLTPRPKPLAPAAFQKLEQITAAAFGQRRKMLRASLKQFALDFHELGIDPTRRAENLSIEQFCRIARAIP